MLTVLGIGASLMTAAGVLEEQWGPQRDWGSGTMRGEEEVETIYG
jgi:hypothetical protein